MISIITPSYNQGKYILETIQSVLTQDVAELEYVVVDGGSTDETLSILKRFSKQLRFVSEKDRGQAHAVNKGIMMTSGDIIGWLNSDDIYYPGTLEKISAFFAEHPEVEVVYGKADYVDQQGKFLKNYPTEPWSFSRLKETCFISQPAVFFRRSVINKVGLLNESLHFCMDYEFWLHLAQRGSTFAYLPQVLAGTRWYPETKTLSFPEKAHQEALQMLKKRLGYVPISWVIGDAIILVKNKTQLRMPDWRYKIGVFLVSFYSLFRWNGFLKGFMQCFSLPKAMVALRRAQG